MSHEDGINYETLSAEASAHSLFLVMFALFLSCSHDSFVQQVRFRPRKVAAIEAWRITHDATVRDTGNYRNGYPNPVVSPRDRLAGLIEARQLTQTDLSRRSNVPRTTINEILCGKRSISKSNAVRLAEYFGVPIEEFIAGNLVG